MIFWIVLLFWYIMSWSDLGRSNSSSGIFYEWAIFLLLWYTLRLFQFLLVCRSLSVWKKNQNHQYIITLLQLFEKHCVTKTDHFIAKHQSWSDHKIHQIQHKFLILFFLNISFFAKIYFKNFQQSIFISLVFCNAYSMQAIH